MSNFGLLTLSGLGAFPLWEALQSHFTSFGHRSVLLRGTEIIKCVKISGLFYQADKETPSVVLPYHRHAGFLSWQTLREWGRRLERPHILHVLI